MPQTSLADRIARLNLVDESSNSSATGGASSSSSSKPKTTGALGRISDKISRFQANAEDAPLVPVGSFGLGGVRREPSLGATSAASDKRVASLGLGRATVPLASVTPVRSVSQGGSPVNTSPRVGSSFNTTSVPGSTAATATATTDLSSSDARSDDAGSSGGTPTSSRASSQYGGMSTDLKSSSSGGSDLPSSIRGLFTRYDSGLSVAGSETTAGGSESSLNVETGSLLSELGPDPKSINISESIAEAANSPLSSPVLSALVNPLEITVDEPSLSPRLSSSTPTSRKPLKGPLDALKTPSRSRSSVSVSSMLVETGSTTSDDADGHSASIGGPETPRAEEEEKPFPTTVGRADDEEEESGMATPGQSEQDDEAREKATQAELAKYEGETFDTVAPRFPDEEEEDVVSRPALSHFVVESPARPRTEKDPVEAPLRSPGATSDTGDSYGDMLDDYGSSSTPDVASPPHSPMPGGMPKVKCSDCGEDVDLMELVDHNCAPASARPAAQPSRTPSYPAPPTLMSPPPPRSSNMTPSSSHDRIMNTARADSPSTSPSRSRTIPDAFVPQTESLVPDDILDAYDDDEDDIVTSNVAAAGPSSSANPDLPDDVGPSYDGDGEDLDSPVDSMPPQPRASVDLPQDVDDEHDPLADSAATINPSPQPRPSGVVSSGRRNSPRSVYETPGRNIYDSEDEESYEGGSVKIVSVTHASHSAR